MDFRLTEDQLMIRRTIRDFAQNEVKPLSKILDARPDPKDCIDWDIVKKASDLGIRVLAIPEEWGGLGADAVTKLIVQEELAAADIGFADLMRGHGEQFSLMNRKQREEFLPLYLEDYKYFIAGASTEPDHGTDHLMMYDEPEASMQTYAEKRGDEYIINGVKRFISHGGIAKLYLIHARTDRKLPIKLCESTFIVTADTPGFSIGRFMNKMGRRLLINAELILEDVHVPIEHKIEEEGDRGGWVAGNEELALKGLILASNIIGLCRCAYEETLNYARTRIQGGKPIIQHQNVALKLAEMKIKIEACRTLVWKHAWSAEKKYEFDPQMFKLIKGFVNKMSVEIISNAVDIHGGLGIDRDLPIEKYLRDVYSTLHGLGVPDISLIRGAPTLTAD